MNVFIVIVCYDYEGETFAGVYSTEELAQARKAELEGKGYGDSVDIIDAEVNKAGGWFL